MLRRSAAPNSSTAPSLSFRKIIPCSFLRWQMLPARTWPKSPPIFAARERRCWYRVRVTWEHACRLLRQIIPTPTLCVSFKAFMRSLSISHSIAASMSTSRGTCERSRARDERVTGVRHCRRHCFRRLATAPKCCCHHRRLYHRRPGPAVETPGGLRDSQAAPWVMACSRIHRHSRERRRGRVVQQFADAGDHTQNRGCASEVWHHLAAPDFHHGYARKDGSR